MNEKRLIVNADDLGMSRGITDAILLAHRYGVVTSASLMANMPAAEYALERLQRAPNLGVGVHLNICQGKPALPPSEVPTLVATDGSFLAPAVMARRLWRWQVAEWQIEAEFRAQIQWMKKHGLNPSHADSHHHMHIYPAAVRPFARALAAEGIRCARSPRCNHWPKNGTIGRSHKGALLRRVLVQSYRGTLHMILFRRISTPESRISFAAHDCANLGGLARQWMLALENLPAGTFELACHPGILEPGFSETDAISSQREHELRLLMDPEMRKAIERNGIRLITFNELRDTRALRRRVAVAAL